MADSLHYHIVGVAGVGMSALAQALQAAGHTVSGSDRHCDQGQELDVVRKLRAGGIRITAQDGGAVTSATHAVVVSTAIEADNPEIVKATACGVPVQHRSEALAALLRGRPCIAIAGTSGKSTVTGMTGWALECLGVDPAVINGAPVVNWRTDDAVGNVRSGMGPWVVEADESDRSLLNLKPTWALVTNVSKDHFDVEESTRLFRAFVARVTDGVVDLVANPDLLDGFDPQVSAAGSTFTFRGHPVELRVPGRHNALNAYATLLLCERLGYDSGAAAEALGEFRGIERRLEKAGEAGGVTVIDDYAHNPAKIRAAWEALAPYAERMLAIWRPHGYGPLRALMDELVTLFREVMQDGDRLYMLPVYDAGGSADRSINSDALVERLADARGVYFVETPADAVTRVVDEARSGDTVLTLGARDPQLPVMAREIVRGLGRARLYSTSASCGRPRCQA